MREIHLDECCSGFAKVSLNDPLLTACIPADMSHGGKMDKRHSETTTVPFRVAKAMLFNDYPGDSTFVIIASAWEIFHSKIPALKFLNTQMHVFISNSSLVCHLPGKGKETQPKGAEKYKFLNSLSGERQ